MTSLLPRSGSIWVSEMLDFPALLTRMFETFVFLCLGYVGRRTKILDAEGDKALSRVIIDIAVPSLMFATIAEGVGLMNRGELLAGMGISLVWQLVLLLLALVPAWLLGRDIGDRGNFTFLFTFGNVGIFGFSVIAPCFGAKGSLVAALGNVAYNIFVFTVGISLVQAGQKEKRGFSWRNFTRPTVLCAVLGFLLCTFNIPCPAPLLTASKSVGAITLPLLMFTVGSSLCEASFREFLQPRILICVGIRLLLLPVLVWWLFGFFPMDPTVRGVLAILSGMPCGGISTTMNILYGTHVKEASLAVFTSTLLSLLTIPLMVLLLIK